MSGSSTRITKAVFPVAGLGTRFLPATKASPKEMLAVVDKPLIQYAVEEAAAAGVTEMIFVTGRNKRAIEDHFDKAYELEAELELKKKWTLLELVNSIRPPGVEFFYVRQTEALGLGHAVLCAERLIGDQPFAVVLADDLLDAEQPVLSQMIARYKESGSSILGVQRIAPEQSRSYGVIAGAPAGPAVHRLHGIVEKPAPDEAPSSLGVVGRYILTPAIFKHLHALTPGFRHVRALAPGVDGEIQLTDAIAALIAEEPVLAYEFLGTRYDCGSKLGYLKASLELALKHPEVGQEFADYLQQRVACA